MTTSLRHYEILFLVHPDHSDQVPIITQNYEKLITSDGGTIHRLEDWGMRPLAYPINKTFKAHYVLMNVECSLKALEEINHDFRFNENVIRNLVLKRDQAITAQSPILAAKFEKTLSKGRGASDETAIVIPDDLELDEVGGTL